MIVDGFSYEIFNKMDPQNIRLYLESSGWDLEEQDDDYAIYSNHRNDEVVSVPKDRNIRNYAYRVEEIVKTVSESDCVSVQQVISGFSLATAADVIEYRYDAYRGEIGTIPVAEIIKIIQKGSDLNRCAYRDMVEHASPEKRLNWKKGALDEVRIGSAIPGSYIVRFVFPLKNIDPSGNNPSDNDLLHKICERTWCSLASVAAAAESGKASLDPELGISHRFVTTMLDLKPENADLEVRLSSCLGKRSEEKAPVRLTNNVFDRISALENTMRPPEMEKEQELVGRIVTTIDHRNDREDGPASVTITYLDEHNKARTARMNLNGEDLDVAYDAAKLRKTVAVSGKVVGTGRSRKIEDVCSIKILSR